MKVFWTNKAQEDLISIGRFIRRDNPKAANRLIINIRKRVLPLKNNPYIGRTVSELSDKSIREILYKNYRIIYKVKTISIDILTVFEGHKLFDVTDTVNPIDQ